MESVPHTMIRPYRRIHICFHCLRSLEAYGEIYSSWFAAGFSAPETFVCKRCLYILGWERSRVMSEILNLRCIWRNTDRLLLNSASN
jgi:hypothetical protein